MEKKRVHCGIHLFYKFDIGMLLVGLLFSISFTQAQYLYSAKLLGCYALHEIFKSDQQEKLAFSKDIFPSVHCRTLLLCTSHIMETFFSGQRSTNFERECCHIFGDQSEWKSISFAYVLHIDVRD